jgi:hypothetical protein
MIGKTFAAVALLAVHGTALAVVNFTPLEVEQSLDGIKFKQLLFDQEGKKIAYQPPRNWTYTGSPGRLRLTPPSFSQAFAEIDQVPLAAPQKFDKETWELLQQKTLSAVPPNSQHIALVAEEKNPLVVAMHETYEVTVSFDVSGQEFVMSVLYLNLPDTQLRFRVVAHKADFERAHTAFRGSIYSWQWK